MRLIRLFIPMLLVLLAVSATAGKREMQKKVQGTWVVDEEASVAHYRNTRKAEDKTDRELNEAIKKMRAFMRSADLQFRFLPFFLAVTNKGNVTNHSLQTKMAAGKVIVFSSTQKSLRTHKNIEFRVTFLSDDKITIDSTDSKDLNLYVWKRLPEKK